MASSLHQLSKLFILKMESQGYSRSVTNSAKQVFSAIVLRHSECGLTELSENIVSKYIAEQHVHFNSSKINKSVLNQRISLAKRIISFPETGNVNPIRRFVGDEYPTYFRELIHQLRSLTEFSEAQRTHLASCANLFFGWLLQQKQDDLSKVDAEILRQYMRHVSSKYNGYAMRRVQSDLKCIFIYLQKHGHISFSFKKILSIPIPVEKKIHPAISPINLSKILDRIDRSTPIGKRNYAIILLGMVTGLRACDVAGLKFSEINWTEGIINLIQSKTGKPLILPLTSDVGKAMEDYILNGRPKVEREQIFLNAVAPYDGISGGAASRALTVHRKAVGLPPKMGFHSLRRAVGKNMVVSGIPVTTIAQILGHSDLNSTKQYISLDSVHLKRCALDFSGIEPTKTSLQHNNLKRCALDFANIVPMKEDVLYD